MTRVLIVTDFEIVRNSLITLFEKETKVELVGCATNGKEAVEKAIKTNPDLIIMCLNMNNKSLCDSIKKIKIYNKYIRIWIFSIEENRKLMEIALKNGADGYLFNDICYEINHIPVRLEEKNIKKQEQMNTANKIFSSGLEAHTQNLNSVLKSNLTAREKEVLKFVVEGMTNQEIATILGISSGRVRNIVAELIMKCMVRNRTQLAVFAIKRGIIP